MREKSDASLLARLAALPATARERLLSDLSPDETLAAAADWRLAARTAQRPPPGDAPIWLMLAGRGFGKTRSGAEWVRTIAETVKGARIALVGPTLDDARRVMVEGESGLLSVGEAEVRPRFYPARRLLHWPSSGAAAVLYSADTPEGLRGPQHHAAWGDELARWRHAEATLANLRLGLRLGSRPRLLLTTTPKPLPVLKTLTRDPDVAVTRGATKDNTLALPASFLAAMDRAYGGTRLGRQELGGELIEDIEGALFTRALMERVRTASAPTQRRVVIGVDPPAGAGAASTCGIVVAMLGADGRAHVLGDLSAAGLSPDGWARQVADAAAVYGADRVVAEVNNGGKMVTDVLKGADRRLPVREVHASRGKVARAEPVAALYESGRVRHVGAFPELEDQLCGLLVGGDYAGPGASPDRADALVWALTELMLKGGAEPGVRGL